MVEYGHYVNTWPVNLCLEKLKGVSRDDWACLHGLQESAACVEDDVAQLTSAVKSMSLWVRAGSLVTNRCSGKSVPRLVCPLSGPAPHKNQFYATYTTFHDVLYGAEHSYRLRCVSVGHGGLRIFPSEPKTASARQRALTVREIGVETIGGSADAAEFYLSVWPFNC